MALIQLLDRVQWRRKLPNPSGGFTWEDLGPERPCRVRVMRQRDTDEALQPRSESTHRILQWYQSGLSPESNRAIVTEASGREPYELELVRFQSPKNDDRRLMLELDCREIAPGSPVT